MMSVMASSISTSSGLSIDEERMSPSELSNKSDGDDHIDQSGEAEVKIHPAQNTYTLSSAMEGMQSAAVHDRQKLRRELSPLTVPSSSSSSHLVASQDLPHHQNTQFLAGSTFPASPAWLQQEQHPFAHFPPPPLPSQGHLQAHVQLQIQSHSQPPYPHHQVQSQLEPQMHHFPQLPPHHFRQQHSLQQYPMMSNQIHQNQLLHRPSLPSQYSHQPTLLNHHHPYTGAEMANVHHLSPHDNQIDRQYHHYHHHHHNDSNPNEVQPQSATLPPYSPLFPSPQEIEYRKHSLSLQEGQFSSLQALQAANSAAACYSPVYHSARYSISPTPPTSMTMDEGRHPFLMAPASAPHRVKRKSEGHQTYYVPSQQATQATASFVPSSSSSSLSIMPIRPRLASQPTIQPIIEQEKRPISPIIPPSSITAPNLATDMQQASTFANSAGPHYGRLPDGRVIELYPAMVRTMHACEHCRSRKAKCSGGNPCERCEKKEVECVYAQVEKRRRMRRIVPHRPDQNRVESSASNCKSNSTVTDNKSQVGFKKAPKGKLLSVDTRSDALREHFSTMGKLLPRRSPRFATFSNETADEEMQVGVQTLTSSFDFDSFSKMTEGIDVEGHGMPTQSKSEIEESVMPTHNSTSCPSTLLSPSSTTSPPSIESTSKDTKAIRDLSTEIPSSHEDLHEGLTAFDENDRNDALHLPLQQGYFRQSGEMIRTAFQ